MEEKDKMNHLTKFMKHQLNMCQENLWLNQKTKFKI